VKLWDVSTGQQVLALRACPELPIRLSFSADGKQLITVGRRQDACIWSATPW